MLAEAFDKEVKTFCQSTEFVPELPLKIDLLGLYKIFLNRKYDICAEEKFKFSMTNVGAEVARKQWVETNVENHQKLALKVLFAEEQLSLFHTDSQCTSLDEDLTRTGIVQIGNGGKLHFIHRTFAEFYVADYFVNKLTKGSNISQEIQKLIIQKIFMGKEYRVIRVFIDGRLSNSEGLREVLKQYGNRIHELGENGVLILHRATGEGNANIIGFLLDSVQVAGHTETLFKLLLAQGDKGQTAWHVAAEGGKVEILDKLWEWAKEVLNTDELNNNLLLAKDWFEQLALHHASYIGNVQILERIWKLAKEQLTPEELNELLLAQDDERKTAWHMAAEEGRVEILDKLWEWAKEVLNTGELNNNFLLAKDSAAKTVLHHASYIGNVQILERIWKLAKEQLTKEELNKFLLAQDNERKTAWQVAEKRGKLEILDKLGEWASEVLNTEELNNLLLASDDEGTNYTRFK
jgi:ankyrin repeat protein